MASQFHDRLIKMVREFDRDLRQDEEVGMRLVSFGQTVTFHVEEIGYHDPSLITFHGTMPDGQKVSLVQHVSQISFLLMAMKRRNPEEPKRPFGFQPPAKELTATES
jgi:hypothetical protein